jgi:hypothetical protein
MSGLVATACAVLSAQQNNRQNLLLSTAAMLLTVPHPGSGSGDRKPQHSALPIDAYAQTDSRPNGFEELIHFTKAEFDDLCNQIEQHLSQRRVRALTSAHPLPAWIVRPTKLTVRNRMLMTMIWLVRYPTYTDLAQRFGVCKSTVSYEIRHAVECLINVLEEIQFPNAAERAIISTAHTHTVGSFGSVDTTSTKIMRPSKQPREHWSGHHKQYEMKTQVVVVPPAGAIVHVSACFPGSVQDK